MRATLQQACHPEIVMVVHPPAGEEKTRTLELLERAAPWIMVVLVVVLVGISLLAAILGAPWAP